MELLRFSTDVLAPGDRLAIFRAGAANFQVDPIGDPLDFSIRWRMVRLGDVNAIHSFSSPVRYRRSAQQIAADGEDRVAVQFRIRGTVAGELDGRAISAQAGDASLWDLTKTVDVANHGLGEHVIVTFPRYLIDEVLPGWSFAGVLPASPALAAAAEQILYLIEHAADIPDAGAPFYARAVRDMFAVAMLPLYEPSADTARDAPLLHRICIMLDRRPADPPTVAALAQMLHAPLARVERCLEHAGGYDLLAERRRLLAAYRLLTNPRETAAVSTIAHRCGFDDLPRFSRRFREVFYTSARDLRRHHRGRLPNWAGAYHLEQNYGALLAR